MKKVFFFFTFLLLSCSQIGEDSDTKKYIEQFSGEKKPLVVDYYSPEGDINVSQNKVVVHFNQPMVALGVIGKAMDSDLVTITPSIKGTYKWVNTKTLVYQVRGNLPYSTEYSIRVNSGKESLLGFALIKDFNFTFRTPTPLAQDVSRVDFIDGKKIVGKRGPFIIQYNQDLKPSSLQKYFSLTVADQENFPISLSCEKKEENKLPPKICKRVVVEPQQDMPLDQVVKLRILKGINGLTGNLATENDEEFIYNTYGPFKIKSVYCDRCKPDIDIVIRSTTPISVESFKKHVIFEPPIKDIDKAYLYWSESQAEFSIYHYLKPNTQYRMSFSKEFTDVFGQPLSSEYPFTFITGHMNPEIVMPAVMDQVHRFHDALNFGFIGVNLENSEAMLKWGMSDKAIINFLKNSRLGLDNLNKREGGWSFRKSFKGSVNDKREAYSLKFSEVLPDKKNEIILANYQSPQLIFHNKKGELVYINNWILHQITDIAIDAKISNEDGLVWVTSLSSGANLSNAKVQIYNAEGLLLFNGATDKKGILKTPGDYTFYEKALKSKKADAKLKHFPLYYFVRYKNDRAFITSNWQDELGYYRMDTYNYRSREPSKTDKTIHAPVNLRAHILTDRGLYKPGETLHVKGYVRQTTSEGLKVFNKPLYVEINLPRSNKNVKIPVTLNEKGNFVTQYTVSENGALGYYGITLKSEMDWLNISNGYIGIKVEKFRTPDFKVTTRSSQKEVIQGESLRATVKGEYLFGSPLKDAKLNYYISQSLHGFSVPKGNWRFGRLYENIIPDETKIYDVYEEKKGVLGSNGEFVINYKTRKYLDPIKLNIDTQAFDLSGQSQGDYKSITIHPASFYIGGKISKLFVKAGEEAPIQVATFDVKGNKLPAKSVHADLYRVKWVSVKKEKLHNQYEVETKREEHILGSCALVTDSQCSLPVKESGYYFYRLHAEDSQKRKAITEIPFYVLGEGFAYWPDESSHILKLVSDKKTYDPGDVAKILVKSPYKKARALISVERGKILSYYQQEIKSSGLIELPLELKHAPNVFVRVVLIKGADDIDPSQNVDEKGGNLPLVKVGTLKLNVSHESKNIAFTIKPHKKVYRPGEKVEIDFKIDKPKLNPNAEITVMVVDEGVLLAGGYTLRDPLNTFYAHYRHEVGQFDARIYYVGVQGLERKLATSASGGGRMSGFRQKFHPLAYFNGAVMMDDDGQGTVSFVLPDQLTNFKIMAIANSEIDHFGLATADIKTKKDIMIRTALPRFLRLGDEFESDIVIHNNQDENSDVKVFIDSKGISPREKTKSVKIKPQTAGKVSLGFKMNEKALRDEMIKNKSFQTTASVSLEAEDDKWDDKVKISFPLYWDVTKETMATAGIVSGEQISFEKGNVFDSIGGLDLKLSNDLLNPIKNQIRSLESYPYECLEQRISKNYPFVIFPVDNDYFMEDYTNSSKRFDAVEKFIDISKKYQNSRGEYRLWPYSDSRPHLTVMMAEFLAHAQNAGHNVEAKFRRIKILLKSYLNDSVSYRLKIYDEEYRKLLKVNTLYVHHLLKEPQPSRYNWLKENFEKFDLMTQARVIEMVYTNDNTDHLVRTWLDKIKNSIRLKGDEAYVDDRVSSYYMGISGKVKSARVLKTLLIVDKQHAMVFPLLKGILNEKTKAFIPSTVEKRELLLALSQFKKSFPKDSQETLIKIMMNSKELLQSRLTLHKPEDEINLPIDKLPSKMNLKLTKEEGSFAFYNMKYQYIPSEARTYDIDMGIAIHRDYYDLEGNYVEPNQLKHMETYKVSMSFFFADDAEYVVVEEPIAAGLEPLNFSLATTKMKRDKKALSNSLGRYIDHNEMHTRKLRLFIDRIPRGFYEFSYYVNATNRGQYSVPSGRALEMYNPEIFGTTAFERVTIH